MRKIILLVVVFCCLLFFSSCANKEESARELYNKAITLMQNGQEEKAVSIYEEIVKDYPGTQVSVEVNKLLLTRKTTMKLIDGFEKIAVRELMGTALDSFRLDNGRYPTDSEGLDVLIYNYSNLPVWSGPYLKSLKYIDLFSYTSTGQNYELKFK